MVKTNGRPVTDLVPNLQGKIGIQSILYKFYMPIEQPSTGKPRYPREDVSACPLSARERFIRR